MAYSSSPRCVQCCFLFVIPLQSFFRCCFFVVFLLAFCHWLNYTLHRLYCRLTFTLCLRCFLFSYPSTRRLPCRWVPVSDGRPVHSDALAMRRWHRLYGPEWWEQLRGCDPHVWPSSQIQLQGLWWGCFHPFKYQRLRTMNLFWVKVKDAALQLVSIEFYSQTDGANYVADHTWRATEEIIWASVLWLLLFVAWGKSSPLLSHSASRFIWNWMLQVWFIFCCFSSKATSVKIGPTNLPIVAF